MSEWNNHLLHRAIQAAPGFNSNQTLPLPYLRHPRDHWKNTIPPQFQILFDFFYLWTLNENSWMFQKAAHSTKPQTISYLNFERILCLILMHLSRDPISAKTWCYGKNPASRSDLCLLINHSPVKPTGNTDRPFIGINMHPGWSGHKRTARSPSVHTWH